MFVACIFIHLTKLFFTLTCTEKPILKILITSFSQYTTICFVSFVYSVFNEHFSALCALGGDDGIRTHDPLLAGQVLSQLSYTPIKVCSCFLQLPFIWKFLWLAFFSKKVTGRTTRFKLCLYTSALRFRAGRTKWTRTTDLVLIRHAL